MSEREMNDIFKKIWDNQIKERLKKGELNLEIDIQTVFRTELEKTNKIGEGKLWRCYHDLMLLKDCGYKYDLVLMKYDSKDAPKKHYPAIVAEFKLWDRDIFSLKQDIRKLNDLKSSQYPKGYYNKPYAYHLMYIVDIRSKKGGDNWQKKLKELKEKYEYEVVIKKYSQEQANQIINKKTDLCQWCRYQGNEDVMDWYATDEKPHKNRELWQIRISYTNTNHKN